MLFGNLFESGHTWNATMKMVQNQINSEYVNWSQLIRDWIKLWTSVMSKPYSGLHINGELM